MQFGILTNCNTQVLDGLDPFSEMGIIPSELGHLKVVDHFNISIEEPDQNFLSQFRAFEKFVHVDNDSSEKVNSGLFLNISNSA